jgi:hypothetical protein
MSPESQPENPGRKPTRLSAKLDKRLASYVTVAGAAGVGMLAWAQPADAEIVYTPVNTPIVVNNGPVAVDINNDGMADFELSNHSYFSHGIGDAFLKVGPAQTGNGIWTVVNRKHQVAAPVFWGVVVASARQFQTKSAYLDFFGLNAQTPSSNTAFGLWGKGIAVTGSYLGLKFTIAGQTHYGWARVEVKAKGSNITATLTGYAYETIPNQPIITGFTEGTLDAESKEVPVTPVTPPPQPASLGHLALGAAGKSQ